MEGGGRVCEGGQAGCGRLGRGALKNA